MVLQRIISIVSYQNKYTKFHKLWQIFLGVISPFWNYLIVYGKLLCKYVLCKNNEWCSLISTLITFLTIKQNEKELLNSFSVVPLKETTLCYRCLDPEREQE